MADFKTRPFNPAQEVTDLTVCRAFFAAWVFAYHVDMHARFSGSHGFFANLLQHGYLGVDGFFILSGLILTRVHSELGRSTATFRRFWLKRLARIYPVHLAVIVLLGILVLAGAAMGAAPRDPDRFSATGLLENLALVQGWGFGNPWTWNYPAWTVSTEALGYLLFPWIARAVHRIGTLVFGQVALLCVPVIGMVEAVSGHALNTATTWPLVRFFAEFFIGMQLAGMVPLMADFLPVKFMLGVAGFLFLAGVWSGGDVIVVLGFAVLLFTLTALADAERPALFRRLPGLRALGLLSYSFYMSFATSELLLAQVFRREHLDPAGHKLLYAAAMTGLTFAIAIILHVLVEKPCRRFADSRLALPKAPGNPGPGNNPVPGSSQSGLAR